MKKSSKKNTLFGRILLWGTIIIVLGLSGFALFGYIWVNRYIKSDAFRDLIVRQLGMATDSQVAVENFSWAGDNLYLAKSVFSPREIRGWKQIEAEGVQSTVDWSDARKGLVRIPIISMDWLRVDLSSINDTVKVDPSEFEATSAPPAIPGWLKGWIPNRTEIGKVEVESFELTPAKDNPIVTVTGMRLTGKPAKDEGAWILRGESGEIRFAGQDKPFRVTSINTRMDARSLAVNDAVARWLGDSEVTARGDLPFEKGKPWSFKGRVSNLDLSHVLSKDWQTKLSGVMEGDYEVNPEMLKAKIRVKSGIAQNMAVLDRVADFTRTDRFRRVVLDEAVADIERKGGVIKVTNLLLQSNGLMRVEGGFTMQGNLIDGTFFVGVSPETLRWIPGAQGRVFTEQRAGGPPGFVWTTVRITGDVNRPNEDLSNRLLAAAGKALLLDTPLTVPQMGLDAAGGVGLPVDGAKAILQGTGESAGKAVETGVDVIKGLVPIFGK
ncbi:hypothetical protein BH11VER1_BH11VER1_23520 [soil metagenome]